MAKTQASRSNRPLVVLLLITVALGAWTFWPGQSHTPKLGLDLRGGTQVILTPKSSEGTITDDQLKQAVNIIRQRVNGLGVAEAEVSVQGQGDSASIVVSVPGVSQQGIANTLQQTAMLNFRAVQRIDIGTPVSPSPTPTPSGSNTASPTASPSASATPTPSGSAAAGSDLVAPIEGDSSAALADAFSKIDCSKESTRGGGITDSADKWIVTCSTDGAFKYLLQPAFIQGTMVDNATAGIPQGGTQWVVDLSFNSQGSSALATISTELVKLPDAQFGAEGPWNQFAIVLDGMVTSAPRFESAILGGNAQITGDYTQAEAEAQANVLRYGALPITLVVGDNQAVSPTLGQDQLDAGILAGGLGLLLVMLYLLFYYRGLGSVAVLSLVVAAIITYFVFVVMGRQIGFTLTLAGVAGAIVAIGITADSFVVYFERIRDEIRDGKGLKTAVHSGWERARRTILVADLVSLLSAAVLYWLSIGSVRGFAFTLGVTTLIDVIVAFYFTHPMVELLARTKWFASGSPATGLDAKRLGVTSVNAPHARSAYAESMGK